MSTEEKYTIEGTKLLREGEHIGDMKGDELKLLPEFKNYQASVTRWVRESAEKEQEELVTAIAPLAAIDPSLKGAIAESPKPVKRQTDDEMIAAAQGRTDDEAIKTAAIYQGDIDFAKRTGCEMPPKVNPATGDKTPAYVDWLHTHRIDEFKKRYGVTGKGKVPIVERNPNTGIHEVVGQREVYFATRKTHLTELDNTRTGLSSHEDWNA